MKNLFIQLGLSEKEMLIFLKMLELGAQPASVIAKHLTIPRSSIYIYLEELKRNGLVEEFDRDFIKYFKAISAEAIADILKAKQKQLEYAMDLYSENLPELKKLENKLSITPKVKFFEGKNAVSKVYEEILKENIFLAFFNPQLVKKIMPEYHFKIPETLKKNNGTAKELLVDCPDAYEYKKLFASNNGSAPAILPSSFSSASSALSCFFFLGILSLQFIDCLL